MILNQLDMGKNILLCFLIGSFITSQAQTNTNLLEYEYSGNFTEIKRTVNYSEIEGSPYLEPNLFHGVVYFYGNDTSHYYMRYNIYLEEMEYLDNEVIKVITNPNHLVKIELNGKTFRYKVGFNSKNKLKGEYFIELKTGTINLYKKPRVEFEEKEPAKNSYVPATNDRFNRLRDTFYYEKEGKLYLIKESKSFLKEIFTENKADVETYLKANKIKPGSEKDLIELFNYANSL